MLWVLAPQSNKGNKPKAPLPKMTDPVHTAMSTAKGNVQKYYVKVKKTGSSVVMYAHEAFDASLICVEKQLHIVELANQLASITKRKKAEKRPHEEEGEASNSRKRPKTSSADSNSDAVSTASSTSSGSVAEQNNYQHTHINLHVENNYYVSFRELYKTTLPFS